jgi:hypothetical protein
MGHVFSNFPKQLFSIARDARNHRISTSRAWQPDCSVATKHPDPAKQIRRRLEALNISMRP